MGDAMNDYWLRGDSEAEVLAAIAQAEIQALPSTESSFDPIGTIYVDDAPIAGWHANLRLRNAMTFDQEAALAPVLIEPPQNPVRIWG